MDCPVCGFSYSESCRICGYDPANVCPDCRNSTVDAAGTCWVCGYAPVRGCPTCRVPWGEGGRCASCGLTRRSALDRGTIFRFLNAKPGRGRWDEAPDKIKKLVPELVSLLLDMLPQGDSSWITQAVRACEMTGDPRCLGPLVSVLECPKIAEHWTGIACDVSSAIEKLGEPGREVTDRLAALMGSERQRRLHGIIAAILTRWGDPRGAEGILPLFAQPTDSTLIRDMLERLERGLDSPGIQRLPADLLQRLLSLDEVPAIETTFFEGGDFYREEIVSIDPGTVRSLARKELERRDKEGRCSTERADDRKILIRCPGCGTRYRVSEFYRGKRVRCARCETRWCVS